MTMYVINYEKFKEKYSSPSINYVKSTILTFKYTLIFSN